jgi:hypothetical protein
LDRAEVFKPSPTFHEFLFMNFSVQTVQLLLDQTIVEKNSAIREQKLDSVNEA